MLTPYQLVIARLVIQTLPNYIDRHTDNEIQVDVFPIQNLSAPTSLWNTNSIISVAISYPLSQLSYAYKETRKTLSSVHSSFQCKLTNNTLIMISFIGHLRLCRRKLHEYKLQLSKVPFNSTTLYCTLALNIPFFPNLNLHCIRC